MRKYHHFTKWEEYLNGMYEDSGSNFELVPDCIEILGNPEKCRNAMQRVVTEWKYTCEDNLTNTGLNRKSWLGQCACNIECKATEDIVRKSWFELTEEQQNEANKIAGEIISEWESNQI